MRRADRLLQIIQIFRRRGGITTAAHLAQELEVSVRTIYRDMVALMASGVPVTGEASVGYVLDKSYDLPPLMLSIDEVEALVLGARFVGAFSQDDPQMLRAAGDALAKIEAVLSPERKTQMEQINLIIGLPGVQMEYPEISPDNAVDIGALRGQIRAGATLKLKYIDAIGNSSSRIVWPLGIGYFGAAKILAAWCETKQAMRNFRLDRIQKIEERNERAPHTRHRLYAEYASYQRAQGARFLD